MGVSLAWLEEHAVLDLRVISLSPTLGVEMLKRKEGRKEGSRKAGRKGRNCQKERAPTADP